MMCAYPWVPVAPRIAWRDGMVSETNVLLCRAEGKDHANHPHRETTRATPCEALLWLPWMREALCGAFAVETFMAAFGPAAAYARRVAAEWEKPLTPSRGTLDFWGVA